MKNKRIKIKEYKIHKQKQNRNESFKLSRPIFIEIAKRKNLPRTSYLYTSLRSARVQTLYP